MAKMSRLEFDNALSMFERKKLRETGITLKFMDLYVANKGTDEEIDEYASLADNEDYLKPVDITGSDTPRKVRNVEKVRAWFIAKYAPGYEYEKYQSSEKTKPSAGEKLRSKLKELKF